MESLTLRLYPNPAAMILNIDGDFAFAKAVIYNLQGQKIVQSNGQAIDVRELKQGMYLIKVITQNGRVLTDRFIKK